MAKKYIYVSSTYQLSNPPNGVTVLQIDTEKNTIGVYNDKKPSITIPASPVISGKFSEDIYITEKQANAIYALKTEIPSFLSNIKYDNVTKELQYSFKLADGSTTQQNISIKDLVDVYVAGKNIKIENNEISFDGNIPTKLSDLQNDSNFISLSALQAYSTDYTAYEVYANDVEIPVGHSNQLGDIVSYTIPANMTDKMVIRSSVTKKDLDIIIDWGDGAISTATDFQLKSEDAASKDYEYYASHTYTTAGKYIVKIYGKQYYGISHNNCDTLLCRAFDTDLPIASCFQNFTYFCGKALRLLNISIPEYATYLNVRNWSSCFNGSTNLRNAIGFQRITPYMISCANIFNDCYSLIHTNFRLPIFGNISMAFRDCKNLSDNIEDLQPLSNFARGQKLNIAFIFNSCTSLIGTITPQKWWQDKDITWSGTRRAFSDSTNITNFKEIPTYYDKTLADKGDAKSDELWNNKEVSAN